jgi:hypothetical protein
MRNRKTRVRHGKETLESPPGKESDVTEDEP